MRNNLEDVSAFNTHLKSGKYSASTKVLAGNVTVTLNGSIVNFFDPAGATRIVTMPPVEKGRFYVINNTGATGTLDVRSEASVTITTLTSNESAMIFGGELAWTALHAGASGLSVFTNVLNGLVPAPFSGVPGALFLRDDGVWGPAGTTVTPDSFKYMTDGTNTATGVGADTFRFRSSDSSMTLTVTAAEAVFGDNLNLRVNAAGINHDALLNFDANEHVDHTAVTLTAGTGISGGGTIAASRTFDFAPSELTSVAPTISDFMVFDLAAGGPRRGLLSSLNGILQHNSLAGYVANEHINHASVSIVASTGLTGGGDLTTSRVISLAIGTLSVDTPGPSDSIPFYDESAGDTNRATVTSFGAILDHNTLLNYVPSQHVDHTAVSINTTNGIQGGGTLAATRTLSLDNPNDTTIYARKGVAWQAIPNITVGPTAPSSPAVNDVWIDTT